MARLETFTSDFPRARGERLPVPRRNQYPHPHRRTSSSSKHPPFDAVETAQPFLVNYVNYVRSRFAGNEHEMMQWRRRVNTHNYAHWKSQLIVHAFARDPSRPT